MKISILISTRNRSNQILDCLNSILENSFQDFEILLVDQSTDLETEKIVKRLNSKKVRFLKRNQKGKSKALNEMIKLAKSEILAFTDDDCIVDKFWLEEIWKSFESYPQVAGVFGNVYPYRPEKHLSEVCPAIFIGDNLLIYNNPEIYPHQKLGHGNNMSLKKSIIEKIGFFKEWLGVGSFSKSGEETELIFRILLSNYSLMTNPKIIVYHNRWLTYKQNNFLQDNHTCGRIALSCYYLFGRGRRYALKFIIIEFRWRLFLVVKNIKYLILEYLKQIIYLFLGIFNILKGFCIGVFMAIKDIIIH